MKHQLTALTVLGGCINAASAIEHAELVSGSLCITYLSTYIAPISRGTADSAPNSTVLDSLAPGLASSTLTVKSELSSLVGDGALTSGGQAPVLTGSDRSSTTLDVPASDLSSLSSGAPGIDVSSATSDIPASETSTGPGLTGRSIIFLVTSTQDIAKRAVGGFVGNSNPQDCTFAAVFTLGSGPASGQLFDGDVPLYHLGEDWQSFQALGVPPEDAITRTFSSEGGVLQFKNPAFPNGPATFCQDPVDGRVYMVFTSLRPSCTPVQLGVYGVEQCVGGRLIGLDTTSASNLATQSTGISTVDEAEETGTLTLPLTGSNAPSDTDTINPSSPTRTERDQSDTTDSASAEASESATDQPTFAESSEGSFTGTAEESSAASQSLPQDSSSDIGASSLGTASSGETAATADTSTNEPGKALTESSVPTESLASIESLGSTETLGSTELPTSADLPTSTESLESSELPTSAETETGSVELPTPSDSPTSSELTTSDAATTTSAEEEPPIITSDALGGGFADGLAVFDVVGDVTYQQGGCYKGDGSPDDGCAAMRVAGRDARKREVSSFASISQTLNGLKPSATVLYTVQFYFAVIMFGGRGLCTLEGCMDNEIFFFNDIASGGGLSVTWMRVLKAVRVRNERATIGISITCEDDAMAIIYLDSLFVSNRVTPENIDRFKLGLDPARSNTSKSSSSTSGSSSPTLRVETTAETSGWIPTASPGDPSLSTPGTPSSVYSNPPLTGSEVLPSSFSGISASLTIAPSNTPVPPGCPGGSCTQKRPPPQGAICEYRGEPEGSWYGMRLSAQPLQGPDIRQCALACLYVPSYKAITANPYYPDRPCYFLMARLGDVSLSPEPTPGFESEFTWSDIECFNCKPCDEVPKPSSKSTWLPGPGSLSGGGENTTPTTPRSLSTGGNMQPTSLDTWRDSTPTPSRRPTSTYSSPSSSPTKTCLYRHGESCEFDRFTPHGDLLCLYAARDNGEAWTEERTDYPHQDKPEQCAAICQSLKGCQSSAYYQLENRCYFTDATLSESDMTIEMNEPWKNSIWSDRTCWTCPDCIPSTVPVTPSEFCSYTFGQFCERAKNPPSGSICDVTGRVDHGWIDGDQVYDRYPLQRFPVECAALCRAMHDCKASAYWNGRCKFLPFKLSYSNSSTSPLQTPVEYSQRNGIWDDPERFLCPGCT